jgi:hypothetical protein
MSNPSKINNMKLNLVLLLLASSLFGAHSEAAPIIDQQAEQDFVYPSFDQALVQLWLAADQKNQEQSASSVKRIKDEWTSISAILSKSGVEHINMTEFVKRVDSYVLSLDLCFEKRDYSCLRSIAYHILFEFRSLRQCLYETEYPLDLIWDAMDAYFEIKSTINDRMFNLKEWFEFEDDVNDFICKWEYYDLRHIKEIQEFYPGINKTEHGEIKEKVNSCLLTLLKSIETGYQSNFVMPCDELGYAMDELLQMYAKSKLKLIM